MQRTPNLTNAVLILLMLTFGTFGLTPPDNASSCDSLVHKHPTHLGAGVVRVGSMRFDVCTITDSKLCNAYALVRGDSSTSNLHGMKFVP